MPLLDRSIVPGHLVWAQIFFCIIKIFLMSFTRSLLKVSRVRTVRFAMLAQSRTRMTKYFNDLFSQPDLLFLYFFYKRETTFGGRDCRFDVL